LRILAAGFRGGQAHGKMPDKSFKIGKQPKGARRKFGRLFFIVIFGYFSGSAKWTFFDC